MIKHIHIDNITSTGSHVPMVISVARVTPQTMIEHQTQVKKKRDSWCNAGGLSCSKFGCRPCCPPSVKLFSELKQRKNMYLVQVKIELEDYYRVYPKVRESTGWCYFGMDGTHKMTRNIQNKISTSFDGQAFRVGGCLGCQYAKSGQCKRFAPALEATGIDVVALASDVFMTDIEWRKAKEPMKTMVAIGGIYTDKELRWAQFKEVIKDATNNK